VAPRRACVVCGVARSRRRAALVADAAMDAATPWPHVVVVLPGLQPDVEAAAAPSARLGALKATPTEASRHPSCPAADATPVAQCSPKPTRVTIPASIEGSPRDPPEPVGVCSRFASSVVERRVRGGAFRSKRPQLRILPGALEESLPLVAMKGTRRIRADVGCRFWSSSFGRTTTTELNRWAARIPV
jgi:hypothetical protein